MESTDGKSRTIRAVRIIQDMKTHSALAKLENCNFTNPNNTLGAIYIVRDPRNVATSFAHHYQMDIDSVIEAMNSEIRCLEENEHNPSTFISSWNSNYNSWKALGDRTLIIKYEDMVNKPEATFRNILETICERMKIIHSLMEQVLTLS